MAAVKYLTREGGLQKLVSAVDVGGTTAQAGLIPALGAQGKLDISMIPTDSLMTNTTTVVAAEDLVANDYVNFFDDAGVGKARKADATQNRPAHGYVAKAAVLGDNVVAYISGMNKGVGLTVGVRYFLGTTGTPTATPDENTGSILQFLGVAVPIADGVGIQFEYDDYIQL